METKGCFRLCFLWQQGHTVWTIGVYMRSRKRAPIPPGSGVFQLARSETRVCFLVCASRHKHTCRYTNRCNYVTTPLPVIPHNSYCLWVFIHQYHLFPNEVETKTRQEVLCSDIYLHTHGHLAHNNILYILCGINNTAECTADTSKSWLAPEVLYNEEPK